MKKIYKTIGLIAVCALVTVGCQQTQEQEEEEKQPEAVVIENEEDDTDVPEEDASAETDEAEDSQEEPEKEEVTVTIYSSNANADGFVTETVNTTDLTAQWLLDQLSAREVIPADVQALSCEVTEADGIKSLNLDLNQAFATFMQSSGTTGEYISLGSVCNTFLDAYGCEQIKITVEGGVLSTGHTEYTGYLGRFE